jgi:hypothetical protein
VLATCAVVYPPVAKADVLTPEPKFCLLAVPRSATSVQDVPFQNSVIPVIPGSVSPPIAKAAKYWQSVREQNTHFENLVHLSFDARKNEVEIEKLQRDIKKEKDPIDKKMKQIELEEKLYGKAQMELVAKHRMREVATWSKLKKEFDDGNFDKKDVNSHQAHSYMLRLQHQKNTITPGTSQPEVFNVLGQIDTLERVIRDKELAPPKEKKKLK